MLPKTKLISKGPAIPTPEVPGRFLEFYINPTWINSQLPFQSLAYFLADQGGAFRRKFSDVLYFDIGRRLSGISSKTHAFAKVQPSHYIIHGFIKRSRDALSSLLLDCFYCVCGDFLHGCRDIYKRHNYIWVYRFPIPCFVTRLIQP